MPTGIDKLLLEGLELRQMPVASFSRVAALRGIRGGSTTILNEAFRDVRSLDGEVGLRLWELWQEIESLCKSLEPFCLSLRDGEKVHEWLTAVRGGRVISVVLSVE